MLPRGRASLAAVGGFEWRAAAAAAAAATAAAGGGGGLLLPRGWRW